jgi:hypothetical protein
VQPLDPLAVLDVSLAAWNVADVPSVDQKYFETGCFQLLVKRYPVDPRRFHGHGRDPADFEPLDQGIQSLRFKALKLRTIGSPSFTESGGTAA